MAENWSESVSYGYISHFINGPKGLQAVKVLQIDNSTASTSISPFEDDDDDFLY